MIRFTREEKIVIIFLLGSLFVGTAVMYYKKTNFPSDKIIEESKEAIPFRNPISNKVNVNTANVRELLRIKHIGPVLAGRIVSYRKRYGPFLDKKDLKNVRGIGDKIYERIKDEIVLE